MTFTTEILKGSPEHRVTDTDGNLVAHAHCVNMPANLFTVVIGGKWRGIVPEAKAIETLKALVG